MGMIKAINFTASILVGEGSGYMGIWVLDDTGRIWKLIYNPRDEVIVHPWSVVTTLPQA